MSLAKSLLERRKTRLRAKLRRRANGRPRLSVFRSGRHIYAQIIDDVKGITLFSASTVEKDIQLKGNKSNIKAAAVVGKLVAERSVAGGITEVVFDRGGYSYHGRIAALADSAREAGLKF